MKFLLGCVLVLQGSSVGRSSAEGFVLLRDEQNCSRPTLLALAQSSLMSAQRNASLPLLFPPHPLNWGSGAALLHLFNMEGDDALT